MSDVAGKVVAGFVLVSVIAAFVVLTVMGKPTEASVVALFGGIVQSVLPSLLPKRSDAKDGAP